MAGPLATRADARLAVSPVAGRPGRGVPRILARMRFGLSLPHYGFSLPGGAPITFEAMAAWARRAEDARVRFGLGLRPLLLLVRAVRGRSDADRRARAADRARGLATRRPSASGCGTLVLCAPFRHPAIVAKMAATIDLLSGGRLDLGLGAGWLEDEFTAFGYPFGTVGERFAALEETLEVLDALFSAAASPSPSTGPRCRCASARLLPAPVQRPIPLWVGGKGGPRLLRLAARHADGWNTVWRMAPSWYAERTAAIEAACDDGRPRPRDVPLDGRPLHADRRGRGRRARGVRARARRDARRRDGRRDLRDLARRHALGHARAGASSGSPRSRRSAWRRSSSRRGCCRSRSPSPNGSTLFVEGVLRPLRDGRS